MRRFLALGTVPLGESSLGEEWEGDEIYAFRRMIERSCGGPPSGVTFDTIRVIYTTMGVAPRTLGLWYTLNDPEAVEYAAMVEAAVEEHRHWDYLAGRDLGPAYINLRRLQRHHDDRENRSHTDTVDRDKGRRIHPGV